MKRALLLAAVIAVAASCAPSPLRLQSFTGYSTYDGVPGEAAYRRSLSAWTRKVRLYHSFETSLLMRAVFKSPSFRQAWAREYARRYILPKEQFALLQERELDDAARFHEVLFAVWADDTRGGDFTSGDPPWRVRLVGDGDRSVEPLVLKRIKKPTTELLTLFPFITPHDRVFIAKFPVLGDDGLPLVTPETPRVKLQVAGVINRGELVWNLKQRTLP